MPRTLAALIAPLALPFLGACNSGGGEDETTEGDIARCNVVCEASKGCAGADASRNCATYCVRLDAIVIGGRCRTRYDSLLDCDEALEDVCDEAVECRTEVDDYSTCVSAYCAGHAEECSAVFGGP